MKYLALAFVGLLWLILTVPDANAVVCARGYYRAGCVSRYGAVGVGQAMRWPSVVMATYIGFQDVLELRQKNLPLVGSLYRHLN